MLAAVLFYFTTFVANHVSEARDDDANVTNCGGCCCNATAVSEQGGVCRCIEDLGEIRCSNLTQVPQFSDIGCLLAGVYLSKQSIRQIGADAFANVPARRLVLNFNDIGVRLSSAAFRGNLSEFLRELYLGACRLRALPVGLLDNMNSLVVLHLWHNRLTRLPTGLFAGCCGSLRELILSHNRLESLESGTFVGLGNLRKLDVDFNEISSLSREVFSGLNSLRVVSQHTLLMRLSECYEYVCPAVSLPVCLRAYLRTYTSDRNLVLCVCYPRPRLGPYSSAALRYVTHLRFCG